MTRSIGWTAHLARAATLALVVALGACSAFGKKDEVAIEERPPEVIYAEARQMLLDGDEERAARQFDEVERLYPYSEWAKRAMIMSAFASYEASDYDQAVLAAERFIEFYPSDDETPYARSLIAQARYEQIVDVGRDQAVTQEARDSLRELINRHPSSDYSTDAELKFDMTTDHLAGKEMEVGRFYLKRGHYLAAINRFRRVVDEYQTTSHTPEALHRLVEAYLALGVEKEAREAASVLGHNFPGSPWYEDSYAMLEGDGVAPGAAGGGFLTRTYRQVIRGDWL